MDHDPTYAQEISPLLAAGGSSADGLGPVHIAYLAAALLLTVRCLVLLRARADVPRLHEEARKWLAKGDGGAEGPLRESSSPYAVMARQLTSSAGSGQSAEELTAVRQRVLGKAAKRNLRSQALDATSILLLLGLSLVGGRGAHLGEVAAWAATFIGLMLLCTIFARASLQYRLELAIRELEALLGRSPRSPSRASICTFCGSGVDAVRVETMLQGAPISAHGVLCRECGKIVASVAADLRTQAVP